jgi:hypothetical protein
MRLVDFLGMYEGWSDERRQFLMVPLTVIIDCYRCRTALKRLLL